tara:strand:+ start:287 stop:445 length:159 start_codon:yes stop_codon:yes gene_type:complete
MKQLSNVLLGVSMGIFLTSIFGDEVLDYTIGLIIFCLAGLLGLGNPLKWFKK